MQKINEELAEKIPVEVQNSTKKRERKTKARMPTQTVEEKTSKFPVEGKINKYGFIYLENDILTAFGLSKGTEQKITIDSQRDGLLILKA